MDPQNARGAKIATNTSKVTRMLGLASKTSTDLPLPYDAPSRAPNAGAGMMKIAPTRSSKRII
ncbi:MAG: hypothetical protein IPP17_26805 [Bacteroidetes bacterium]|nr:hypothetical protein [Bacteroidota bacterium]